MIIYIKNIKKQYNPILIYKLNRFLLYLKL